MKLCCLLFLGLLFISCEVEQEMTAPVLIPDLMENPANFPAIPVPEGNEFSQDRWDLGKRLFFDEALSIDNSISCANCHQPNLAFSDDVDFSLGVEDRIGTRNSPSLANVAYHPYFTREGGVPTLEMQVLVPIQEHNEFDFNIVLIAERLSEDSSYVEMARNAYQREVNAFVITRALACFERSLLSGYSPYDQYISYDDKAALTDQEVRGMELFFSDKTNCSSCHSGFNFTNYAFENNGLYEEYLDEGRLRFTKDEMDRALFKVPGLRNVGITAPYMHDGSMSTLEEVIEHYQAGGKDHPHKNELIRPLNLSEQEKDELILFLKALTDDTFVNNPLFNK